MFAADGCIIPNTNTRQYKVTFSAPCEHTKLRRVEVVLDATDEDAAASFAETWLRQGPMRQLVVTSVDEYESDSMGVTAG